MDKNQLFCKEVKDLKNFAIIMMRAGADLLNTVEVLEQEVVKGHMPIPYKLAFIDSQRQWRENTLEFKYEVLMSDLESNLWNKLTCKEEE